MGSRVLITAGWYYLSKDKPTQPVGAVLVLNSTNLWQRALPYINDPRFEEVRLYLDNDDAGQAATRKHLPNLLICAATMRTMMISTHGCLVEKRKPFFLFPPQKLENHQLNRRGP